jgi:hypothetical protein
MPSYADPQDARAFLNAALRLVIGRQALVAAIQLKNDGALLESVQDLDDEHSVIVAQALRAELHRRDPQVWR